ncbi:MAG: hypothetical protein PHR30_17990 [Gallionellaceae bacterium]|nr:hypothetical protein [Gallionellaceae bacterium]MDD5367233.1 hypothetical protein [Gallionellaceae bacterium]
MAQPLVRVSVQAHARMAGVKVRSAGRSQNADKRPTRCARRLACKAMAQPLVRVSVQAHARMAGVKVRSAGRRQNRAAPSDPLTP